MREFQFFWENISKSRLWQNPVTLHHFSKAKIESYKTYENIIENQAFAPDKTRYVLLILLISKLLIILSIFILYKLFKMG